MHTQTPRKAELFARALRTILLGVFAVFVCLSLLLSLHHPLTATAASNATLNFQARLETGSGAIAPDGSYNVEFKLYNATSSTGSSQGSCTGDANCLWTETRTSAAKVTVTNGYLTVNLGSVTAFPTTINWDQNLYLTMNIGGTATTPSWDGEMNPRLQLTAVPYAFQAKSASQLQANQGTYTGSLQIATLTGGNQTFQIQDQGAAGTYNLLTQNQANANYIQNQSAVHQVGNIDLVSASDTTAVRIQGYATGSSPVLKLVAGAGATGSDLLSGYNTSNVKVFSVYNTGDLYTAGTLSTFNSGSVSGTVDMYLRTGNASNGNSGNVYIDSGTATGTAGTVKIGTSQASGISIGRVGVTTQLQGGLSVTGTGTFTGTVSGANATLSNQFVTLGQSTTAYAAASGSANYIQNTTSQQTSANFNIDGTGVAGALQTGSLDAASSTALNIGTTKATAINLNQNTVLAADKGLTVNYSAGNANALTVNNSTGSLFNVDTTNTRVTVGNIGSCVGAVAQGKLCVAQGASGTTGSVVAQNTALAVSTTAAGSYYGQYMNLVDTSVSQASSLYGMYVDATSTTNAAASVISYKAKVAASQPGNFLQFQNGASTVLTATNSGRLGLGTANPTYLLDVQGGTGIVAQFSGRVIGANAVSNNEFATLGQVNSLIAGSGAGAGVTSLNALSGALTIQGNAQIAVDATTSPNIKLSLQADSIGDAQLAFNTGQNLTTASTPQFAGILINTTAAVNNALIDVKMTDASQTGLVLQATSGGQTANLFEAYTPDGELGTYINNTAALRVQASADGVIAAKIQQHSATQSADLLQFAAYNGNKLSVFDATGRLGLGTGSPGYMLDVAGSVNSVSGYVVNGTAGAGITCTGGDVVSNATIQGGIVTGGTCAANGGGVAPTLQDVYNNSANGNLVIDSTRGALVIKDSATSQPTILNVTNNSGSQSYLSVSAAGVSMSNGTLQVAVGSTVVNGTSFTSNTNLNFIGNGNGITVGGKPVASATTALVQLGNSLSGANNVSNGGTVLGSNLPSSGVGSAADFLNFQKAGATVLKVDNSGGITSSTTINAVTGFKFNGTAGATTTCSGGQVLSNAVVQGGIVTSGTCATNGGGIAPTLQDAYNNSTSPASILLGDAKNFVVTAADTATDPSILFNLQCVTSCGSNGRFAVQNAGTDVFAVNPNGTVVIGSATNGITLSASGITLSGTARPGVRIPLMAEYPNAVLDNGSTGNNAGTMTSGYDMSNRMNYYKWTTTQSTNQTYDVVTQVPIPDNWGAWNGNIDVSAYTSNTTNGTVKIQAIDSNGVVESDCNFVSATPAATGAWQTTSNCNLSTSGNTYTAGGYITLRIRLQSPNAGDVRVGNITLYYKANR